ncbi:RNA 2',3'-cyclic phosphodiesterase [Geodermatophilus sp. TF02-6]|uniref:RNA 2',3'-cyclic phosphodiesterase n=1 Tax=Geodermatophilus sp. TF02-6 TaxID=2250575 RepID=UPI00272E8441|nr:RNA 2',3'-cyclic phosphodiesterase [Geodermatophilus sp. TF02-6]
MFFAVTPPPEALADLDRALAPLRNAPGAPRWTASGRWHLTLLFLGDVPAAQVAPLVAAAGPAVAATPPLQLRLAGGGRFGSRRRPQVFWAGVTGDGDGLGALAGRLARAARRRGLPVEDRPFRAHLTLGRWRPGRPGDGDLPDRLAGYCGPSWPVTEVELLESHLGPTPRYDRVAAWPLGTSAPAPSRGSPRACEG